MQSLERGTKRSKRIADVSTVAGLIAAIDGNGEGIDGIAPNASLMVADVSSASNDTFEPASIENAIRWAVDGHARVINLSLSGLGPVSGYQRAVDYALAHGALVVAAAGNCFDERFSRCTPSGFTQAPAWLPHVLTVGATAANRTPAGFSIPSARWVDLAAPGELVATLWPTRNNPYLATPDCSFAGTTSCYSTGGAQNQPWGPTGTSFATAMVSAAAAIIFGADPHLLPEQVASLLEQTAHPISDPRHQTGAGLLDVNAALQRVERGAVPPADFGEPNDRVEDATRIEVGRRIGATLDWTDDPADVYRVSLRRGESAVLETSGTARGTISVACGSNSARGQIGQRLRFEARRSGACVVRLTPKSERAGAYGLLIRRT